MSEPNPTLPARHWQDTRWPEFRRLPQNTVAVLPVGAIELLERALSAARADLPLTALPIQSVGKSEELRSAGMPA